MSSIYEKVKARFGAGPSYPNRAEYKSVIGYKAGETLGVFPDIAAAKGAGAAVTERSFDDAGFRAEKAIWENHQNMIVSTWYEEVRNEYPEVNDALFSVIYNKAYDRGHSCGYSEVELYIYEYVEFAKDIIKANAIEVITC